MKMFSYYLLKIFIIIVFVFFSAKITLAQEYNILDDKEFLEIAETVSFVYFQLYDLQCIGLPFIKNIDTKRESLSDIKEGIMNEYRNILYKNSENYMYSIDTFYHPIFDKLGVRLYNSHYNFKKYSDNVKGRLKNYKMAIDKCGKCYKLFGFGYKNDDFEELYRSFFLELKTTNEVNDLINFYVFNVLHNGLHDYKVEIIDSTNKRNYSKYYPEITLPSITKNEGVWTASFSVLVYSEYFDSVKLYEYIFFLNEKDRKFSYKVNLIKEYYIESP